MNYFKITQKCTSAFLLTMGKIFKSLLVLEFDSYFFFPLLTVSEMMRLREGTTSLPVS